MAEITPREAQRYCVDIVLLKGGAELWGSLLARTPVLKIAVQRDWLTTHQPEMAEQAAELESQQQKANQEQLAQRITSWRTDRADQPRLTFVLDRELELLKKPAGPKVAPSQFVIVTVPPDRVRGSLKLPQPLAISQRPPGLSDWNASRTRSLANSRLRSKRLIPSGPPRSSTSPTGSRKDNLRATTNGPPGKRSGSSSSVRS